MLFTTRTTLAVLAAALTTTTTANARPLTIGYGFTTSSQLETAIDNTMTTALEVASSISGAFRLMVAGCGGDDCAERNDGRYIKHTAGSLHPAGDDDADAVGTTFLLDPASERLTDASGSLVAAVDGVGSGSQFIMADRQALADKAFVPLRCSVTGGDRLQCTGPNLAEIALCSVQSGARTSETKVSLLSGDDDNYDCPLAVLYVEPE